MGTFLFFGGIIADRLFIGKKLNQLISFSEEENRKKTEEAIADLGWLKFILEGERKNELEIDRYMREKIFTLQWKYEDYLNLREKLMLGSELLRRIERALCLIEEHGYHEGRKYMLKEVQEKKNKDSTNPRFWETQS